MSDASKTNSPDQPAEIISLARTRDKMMAIRQDRAEGELAKRFHDVMGWKDKPAAPRKKKPKKKR